jgi:hypothetical protein
MKLLLSACLSLCGGVLLQGLASAHDSSASSLQAGYNQVIRDLHYHWWDPNYGIPRIRPTRGDNSTAEVGTIDDTAAFPSFWQMEEYSNVQYWNWKMTHSSVTKAEIWSQWRYIRSVFSDHALSSAGKSNLMINVSDDAAWALNYLVQVHEVTRDQRALADAVALLPSILNRFADPNAPRVHYGSLLASPYGILYATASDDPDHQGRSSSYEIMLANAAIYIYQQTHDADDLNYAIGTYNWTKKYMKHPTRGYYYCELDLRPAVNGSKNPHYLVPMGDYYGLPVRGLSSSYSGGTMAMAVAAARLYRITGQPQYLAEARQITSDYVRRDAFLRPGNLFVNERDGWTDGFWAPAFADEVLTLPGVDSTGLWKTTLHNTARSIISQRTPDGFYGADWSGPELNTNDHSMTWAEQATHGAGSGGGMALPGQIMTSSNSAAMVTAAEMVDARPHPNTVNAAEPPIPNGEYFVGHFSTRRDAIALRQENKFFYQSHDIHSAGSQIAVVTFGNGSSEDQYLVGDFTGSGRDALAVRHGNEIVYQTHGITSTAAQIGIIHFGNGNSEDQYLVGDFTGIGRDGLAVRRGNQIIYQTNGITSATWEVRTGAFGAGNTEDQYLVGDFTGIVRDELAVRRGNQIIYQTHGITSTGHQVATLNFGHATPQEQYLVGDFTGRRRDALAVRTENQFLYEKGGIADPISTGVITFSLTNDPNK